MKKKTDTKFSWCPVCMIHTYHRKAKGDWHCLNPEHQALLHYRTDPWIEEYRRVKLESQIPSPSEV